MTVRVYRSTDVGAPILNNTAGALIAVLDWCLVTGSPLPAGWTKEYSDTNKAAYKQGLGSNGFYLRVDDSDLTAAKVTGYESMTTVDVGTGIFPHPTQTSDTSLTTSYFYIRKSDGSNTNPREWVLVASESLFYLYVNATSTTGSYANAMMYCFGDILSFSSTDQYATILIANSTSGSTFNAFPSISTDTVGAANHVLARSYHQFGGSIPAGKLSIASLTNTTIGQGKVDYPDPITGDLKILPVYVTEAGSLTVLNVTRGKLPGLWAMCHYLPFNHGDTFSGKSGTSLAGKTFEVFRCTSRGNAQVIIETSDTW